VKLVRIFNTYGPRMAADDGRVVSNFITQALQGNPLTVYGDGSQTRSFMYVDDLVEGLMRMIQTRDDCTGPLNLGNPQETIIMDLARQVVALTGTSSPIIQKERPLDDPRLRCPDITLASQLLGGWKAGVPLEDGLIKTILYFKTNIAQRLS
jgi:UDP-glucuronate decarboxylase